MRVRFLVEWYGSQPGSEMVISDSFARNDLIPRGIAEEVDEPKKKQIAEAPKDKMVRGAKAK